VGAAGGLILDEVEEEDSGSQYGSSDAEEDRDGDQSITDGDGSAHGASDAEGAGVEDKNGREDPDDDAKDDVEASAEA